MKTNFFDLNSVEFNRLIDSLVQPNYLDFYRMSSQKTIWKYHIKSFAENKSAKEFINQCNNRNILIWLYTILKPNDLKNRILIKTQCAKIISNLLTDTRSLKAIDTAYNFCVGKAELKELETAKIYAEKAITWASKEIFGLERFLVEIDPPNNEDRDYNQIKIYTDELNEIYLELFCVTLAFEAVDYETLSANAELSISGIPAEFNFLMSQMVNLCRNKLPFNEIYFDENLVVID